MDPKLAEPRHLFFALWAGDSDWSGHLDPQELPTWALIDYVRAEYYTPVAGADGGDFTLAFVDRFKN